MDAAIVWERLNPTQQAASPSPKATSPEEAGEQRSRFWHQVHLLDILAAVIWGYVVSKAFVVDWDVALLQHIAPEYAWLPQVRLVIFLVVLAALVWRGRSKSLLWIGFVLLWPVLFVVWRLPRLLWRHRAWNEAIAIVQLLTTPFGSVVAIVLLLPVAAAALMACLWGAGWVAFVGSLAAHLVWLAFIVLSMRSILRTPTILSWQNKIVSRMREHVGSGSTFFWGDNVDLALREAEQRPLTPAESDAFLQGISFQVSAIHLMPVWAEKIRLYFSSAYYYILGPVYVLVMFVTTAFLFGAAANGLYRSDSSAFTITDGHTSFVYFFYYAITGVYGGETAIITPQSSIAVASKTALAIIGPILLLVIVVSLLQSWRNARDQQATKQIASEFEKIAQQARQEFPKRFSMSPEEARLKLLAIGFGLASWIPRDETEASTEPPPAERAP